MNVYDFDKTIYKSDSTLDFYLFCLKKMPFILKRLPKQFYSAVLYKLGKITKTEFKENFYIFLNDLPDIDILINEFWNIHCGKIKNFYLDGKKDDDIIISDSPTFLLEPICKKLNITYLIASKVDKHTGKYTGINCYGSEKVRRFKEIFPDQSIDNFYSDSLSDAPIAKLAKHAFLVSKKHIKNWEP